MAVRETGMGAGAVSGNLDPVGFITARLDEDEALIRRNSDGRGLAGGFPDYRTYSGDDIDAADEYIEHFSPARALREVEVKREILTAYIKTEASGHRVDRHAWIALRFAVETLAGVWSDNPEYRQEWAE